MSEARPSDGALRRRLGVSSIRRGGRVQTESRVPRRWLAAPATRRWALLAAFVGVALTASSAYSVVSGSPSFSKPQRYQTGMFRGQRLHLDAVAVGDVNGDRRQDLVGVGSNTDLRVQEGGVSISLNRGRGNFGPARTYRIGYDSYCGHDRRSERRRQAGSRNGER